jgi:uncharacterized SAM-binding protein YcdF (DUF218 family)
MKKQGRMREKLAAALALAASLLLFGAYAGKLLVVDAPHPSDVILVLAGETDRRPARGLQLLDQGYGRRLVLNVPAAAMTYKFTQVELAQRYIQSLPEAAAITVCPTEGLSTKDEARDAEKCLGKEHSGSVLIVTSDFHTRRALSVFRHELPDRSFSVAASYDDTQFGRRWWSRRQWAKTAVDEWLRLLWWNVVDRWR